MMLLAACLVWLGAAAHACAAATPSRPNLVLIVADDLDRVVLER